MGGFLIVWKCCLCVPAKQELFFPTSCKLGPCCSLADKTHQVFCSAIVSLEHLSSQELVLHKGLPCGAQAPGRETVLLSSWILGVLPPHCSRLPGHRTWESYFQLVLQSCPCLPSLAEPAGEEANGLLPSSSVLPVKGIS